MTDVTRVPVTLRDKPHGPRDIMTDPSVTRWRLNVATVTQSHTN